MKAELQNKLFEKCPRIFGQKDLLATQACMQVAIATGDGWYNILDVLCSNIQHHLDWNNGEGEFEYCKKFHKEDHVTIPQVEATQVKEKFGGLRFYMSGGDDFVEGLISMAESISLRTCEECGCPGTQNNVGWVRTQCDPCRKNYDEIRQKAWDEIVSSKEEKGCE
jgi:hypothetical protein